MDSSNLGTGLIIGLAIGLASMKANSKSSIYKKIINICSEKNIKIYSGSDEISIDEFINSLNL